MDDNVAVVLSGGGANGAYEVGVLKALLEGSSCSTGYRPIDPGIFTGTSVGGYNATVMASQPGVPMRLKAEHLERLWVTEIANTLTNCGNGVYRVRGLPFQFLDPGCLAHPVKSLLHFGKDVAELSAFGLAKGIEFATSHANLQSRLISLVDIGAFVEEQPFLELVHRTIDLDSLARSARKLTIAASNWSQGTVRLFSRQEITGDIGLSAVVASASLPGLFRPVKIQGDQFVDGGVLANTPLLPAIADGADVIHVVLLDPLIDSIQLPPLPSTADVVYLSTAIIWAARLREDARRIGAINDTLDLLLRRLPEEAKEEARHQDRDMNRSFLEVGRRVYERHRAQRPYRFLDVHVYRPDSLLGGGAGLLDFDANRLGNLIERGYSDTVHHDCRANGCVLGRSAA